MQSPPRVAARYRKCKKRLEQISAALNDLSQSEILVENPLLLAPATASHQHSRWQWPGLIAAVLLLIMAVASALYFGDKQSLVNRNAMNYSTVAKTCKTGLSLS